MLNIRRQRRGGLWRDTRLENKMFDMKELHEQHEGVLSFFYIDSDTLAPEYWKAPSVAFKFNIKKNSVNKAIFNLDKLPSYQRTIPIYELKS